jgi:hypothetical protein
MKRTSDTPPRTLPGAELRATMLGENVQPPDEPRTGGIGLAMVWLPLGVIFARVTLAFLAWKTA